jgi:uncharacterized protein with GYD domain
MCTANFRFWRKAEGCRPLLTMWTGANVAPPREGGIMTIYIIRGNYSDHAFQGMLKQPENRHDAVEKLIKSAGGKMLAYYVTMGEYDFLVISEFDNEIDGLSALLVAAQQRYLLRSGLRNGRGNGRRSARAGPGAACGEPLRETLP